MRARYTLACKSNFFFSGSLIRKYAELTDAEVDDEIDAGRTDTLDPVDPRVLLFHASDNLALVGVVALCALGDRYRSGSEVRGEDVMGPCLSLLAEAEFATGGGV